jgi:hypothetical protein
MSSDVGPPKDQDWGGEREDDMAWWTHELGRRNKETTRTNLLLGMKIFFLHPNNFI